MTILEIALDKPYGAPFVEELIKQRVNPNSMDPEGYRPIHRAAFHGDLEELQILLEKYPENHADINALTDEGLHLIHILLMPSAKIKSNESLYVLYSKLPIQLAVML